MIRVRPVHCSDHPGEWDRLLIALGAARVGAGSTGLREYDTASGTIAIRGGPGESTLGFTTTDLNGLRASLRAAGLAVHPATDGEGACLVSESGVSTHLSELRRAPLNVPGGLAPLQIWYQPDADEMRRVYTALGLRPRIVADAPGGWVDYVADGGGLSAQHPSADVRIDATSFEFVGDLDRLADTVERAGFEASVVDEAYNRTLLVASPDGGKVWVNGPQEDLYGYHRVD